MVVVVIKSCFVCGSFYDEMGIFVRGGWFFLVICIFG